MMQKPVKIPVTLLTGFLGSGKTTLLNGMVTRPLRARTVVIINELGQIGIDRALLGVMPGEVVQLDSGCLCCGMLNSFRDTLVSLLEKRARREIPAFERVLVETTGLADPTPILQSLLRDPLLVPCYSLAGVTTAVDAVFGALNLASHREARVQVALADRLIVTKADLRQGECPAPLRDALRVLNATAPLRVASRGRIAAADSPEDEWLEPAADRFYALPPHDGPRHEAEIVSEAFIIEHRVGWSGLAAWMQFMRERVGDGLLRCKGFLLIAELNRPVVIQGVRQVFAAPRPLADWPDGDHRSRLVCISQSLEPGLLRRNLDLLATERGLRLQ